MQVKTEMKVGKEPEGGRKERGVGNESPWLPYFKRNKTTTDFQKA
jgi:hypothetical protein